MQDHRKLSRRGFLKASAAAGVAGAAFPTIIPSHVLAAPGRQGANDRVNIAHIGTGGRGMDHVQEGAVAVCDVDLHHMAAAIEKAKGKPFSTQDYRRILDRKDVDAVMIATPDHWHAIMTVDACKAGKDVYTEKPTCRTIHEGLAMIAATNAFGRVVQVGSQGRSHPDTRSMAQYVRNGKLGKVKEVEVWHPVNFTKGGDKPNSEPPKHVNWDLWLGPARWRPYNTAIHPFNFRWMMDFGAGFIRDRGNHVLSCVMWAMGADTTGPVTVEATGEPEKEPTVWDVPVTMEVKWEFKNPDWTLTWSQPGRQRPFPGTNNNIDWGAEFRGDKETLLFKNGDSSCDTEQKAKDYEPPSDGIVLPKSPGHRENWLECIKTRQKPIMNIEVGHNTIVLPIIANISYVLGRKLQWDHAKQEFVGDEEANRLLGQPYRAPFHL